MLMLLFSVGEERYAIQSHHVVEIVPKVHLKEIPHVPPYIMGMLNFRGEPVPIVDICKLLKDRPTSSQYHSRIIVLKITTKEKGDCLFGILAEKVTETANYNPEDFFSGGVELKDTPYLQGVLTEGKEEIRYIAIKKIFEMVKDSLFSL